MDKILHVGDLVKITSTALSYFSGRLAIVIELVYSVPEQNKIQKVGYERPGNYYHIKLADKDDTHIFHREDLELLSKTEIKNE